MRLSEKNRPALVLSGGGVKAAAFHIGVCIALREKGFQFAGGSHDQVNATFPDNSMTFKTYVGSSAGSVISAFLAAGYSVDSIVDAFTQGQGMDQQFSRQRKTPKPTYLRPITYSDLFSLNVPSGHPSRLLSGFFKKKPVISGGLEVLFKKGFKVSGLFSAENLEKYLRENAHPENTFHSLGVELYVVATQLNHSRKVVFGPFGETEKHDHIKYAGYAKVSEAVAASVSLPPVFTPYGLNNEKGKKVYFFDGEIRDTLSTHVASDHGADLVIASYSMQPYHFNKEIGSLHQFGVPMILEQALYQCVQQKIDSSRQFKRDVKQLINAVDGYLKQTNIEVEHREKLLEILVSRTRYKPDVEYIYIHPRSQDYDMFFADHFSLNPKILSKIVRTGFKSAMSALRKHSV